MKTRHLVDVDVGTGPAPANGQVAISSRNTSADVSSTGWTANDVTSPESYTLAVADAAVDVSVRGVPRRWPVSTVRAAVAAGLVTPTPAAIDAAVEALILDGTLALNAPRVRRFCRWVPAP